MQSIGNVLMYFLTGRLLTITTRNFLASMLFSVLTHAGVAVSLPWQV